MPTTQVPSLPQYRPQVRRRPSSKPIGKFLVLSRFEVCPVRRTITKFFESSR